MNLDGGTLFTGEKFFIQPEQTGILQLKFLNRLVLSHISIVAMNNPSNFIKLNNSVFFSQQFSFQK